MGTCIKLIRGNTIPFTGPYFLCSCFASPLCCCLLYPMQPFHCPCCFCLPLSTLPSFSSFPFSSHLPTTHLSHMASTMAYLPHSPLALRPTAATSHLPSSLPCSISPLQQCLVGLLHSPCGG